METRMKLYDCRQTGGEWLLALVLDARGLNVDERGWFCLAVTDEGWKNYNPRQQLDEARARKAAWPR